MSSLNQRKHIYITFVNLINFSGKNMIKIILSLLFFLSPTLSHSHSQLTEILPRENVVYSKTPPEIKLKFSHR